MTTLDSLHYFDSKWQLWRCAKQFPRLVQRCNYTLTFYLGKSDFGWLWGSHKRNYSGPRLDLTGATVKLVAEKMPIKPSYLDEARGETWSTTDTIFTVTGSVVDAEEGEVSFTLSTLNTDVLGAVLAQIQVTDSSDNEIVPGHVRINFTERLG